MALSYDEAVAQLTASGGRFRIERRIVRGIEVARYVNAPAHLREVFDGSRTRADDPFLVYEGTRWSFGDVMTRVDALGAALVERYAVRKGDRVMIAMRNYPEWVVSYGAITSIGAIAVAANAWWTSSELEFVLDDSTPTLIVADDRRLESLGDAAARRNIRMIGVRLRRSIGGVDHWDNVIRLGATPPLVPLAGDDDSTIFYTSGTTGRPMGVVSTHDAVTQTLMSLRMRGELDRLRRSPPDERAPTNNDARRHGRAFILVVPLFHMTGCVPVMLTAWWNGIKLVMMYRWDADRALELIEAERVTNFVGVPTQSRDLIQSPRFAQTDTSSLVSIASGGAPAPPELADRVDRSFRMARPMLGYGLTETTGAGPGISGDDYAQRRTSCGRVPPIMDVEVRDSDRRALPPFTVGEIWFKSPTLMRCYWQRPTETAASLIDGWLRTGDLGYVDEEQYLYVVDRLKDMVLRGGENVYCAEVEAALCEHPAVLEAAVFGVADERLGEQVAAVVVLKRGHSLDSNSLAAHVAGRLAAFKVPEVIVFQDESLPRNAAGKIVKTELRTSVTATLHARSENQ